MENQSIIQRPTWIGERIGLIMIVASVLVISFIIVLLLSYQQQMKEQQNRVQGVSLIRILAGLPFERLVSSHQPQAALSILRYTQSNSNFAYIAVVDKEGRVLNEQTATGVIVPEKVIQNEPSSWLGEQVIKTNTGEYMEYHAPILSEGELQGYLRLGYVKPGLGLSLTEVAWYATLALPIFLLAPLFYFLIKKEISPLKNVNHALESLVRENQFKQVDINAKGELGYFLRYFNQFVETAKGKLDSMESEQFQMHTSSKLLSYQRKQMESVLQSLPEGVVVLDEMGAVGFANNKVAQLFDLPVVQMIGKHFSEWCEHSDIVSFVSRFENASFKSYSSDALEFRPDNEPDKIVQVVAYPLVSPNQDRKLQGTLIVFRDITDEYLAKKNRAEFVAHVAHELKTPLNVLAMYSEALLGEDGEVEEFRVEGLNTIHDEVERLSTLINNLLSLTRFETGNIHIDKKRVKLNEFLEDAFANVSKSGKGAELTFDIKVPKEMSAITADKGLLRIAINNLLTNAIKYNNKGGRVELEAEENERLITIKVRDTGLGISEKDQEKIFDKFYRSDDEEVRQRTGHGLGLPLAKEIIELHRGKLELRSEVGKGSEFTIVFDKESGLIQRAI